MKLSLWLIIPVLLAACGDDGGVGRVDGDACEVDDQCVSDLCVTKYGDNVEAPGGFCTVECEWLYDDNGDYIGDDCVEGYTCLNYNRTGEMFCYLLCESGEDCREEDGWACAFVDFSTLACIPPI